MRPKKISLLDTKPRVCFFVQTIFGTAFVNLTSGVFLSGLALLMGAGDILVSYISVIINIAGVLILFFSTVLERFTSRKKLAIGLTVLSRIVTLLIVAIPAVIPSAARLYVFVPTVVVAFALQAQTTVVLNQWMTGFMNPKTSGRYISLRQTLTVATTVILALIGGYWMDYMADDQYIGFVAVFAAAAVAAAAELVLLALTPDGEPYIKPRSRFRDIFKIPFKNRTYAAFVAYIVVFYLVFYIAESFTMVYMMKYLALSYQLTNGLYLIISLPQVLFLWIWGKLSDKYGHDFTLKTSIWLFAGNMLFMTFASPALWFVFIPIAFLFSSLANAGFVISVFNKRYELMPSNNRILFDNFYSAGVGIGVITGPLLGGLIKSGFEANAAISSAIPFAGIRLLYPIAAAGIVLLQIVYILVTRRLRRKCAAKKTSADCKTAYGYTEESPPMIGAHCVTPLSPPCAAAATCAPVYPAYCEAVVTPEPPPASESESVTEPPPEPPDRLT